MRFAWSNLTHFEKTAVVVSLFELALFVGVASFPSPLMGFIYINFWWLVCPPSLALAPLVYRLFRYLDEERPLDQRSDKPHSHVRGTERREV